jgi:hypothetical protein
MEWNGEVVRKWLESRFIASQRDQDRLRERSRPIVGREPGRAA